MRRLGDVIVISTEHPMSGKSHSVTLQIPLRLNLITDEPGYKEYRTNGTPVDAVKLIKHSILSDETPDLLVSGINHGSNASINIIYSGTMGAVLEGCIDGIPSIGFSICDYSPDADFSHIVKFLRMDCLKEWLSM